MSPALRFFAVAVGLMGFWATSDAIFVLAGQPRMPAGWLSGNAFWLGAYVAFAWAAWPLFPARAMWKRCLQSALTALLALAIWAMPAMIFMLWFHTAIGGRK